MKDIIDFESRKNEKLKAKAEGLSEECRLAMDALGVAPKINLNNLFYEVDNQLVVDGWNPCGSVPLDEDYFTNRKEQLSYIGFPNIREERSIERSSKKPCVVFYGRVN